MIRIYHFIELRSGSRMCVCPQPWRPRYINLQIKFLLSGRRFHLHSRLIDVQTLLSAKQNTHLFSPLMRRSICRGQKGVVTFLAIISWTITLRDTFSFAEGSSGEKYPAFFLRTLTEGATAWNNTRPLLTKIRAFHSSRQTICNSSSKLNSLRGKAVCWRWIVKKWSILASNCFIYQFGPRTGWSAFDVCNGLVIDGVISVTRIDSFRTFVCVILSKLPIIRRAAVRNPFRNGAFVCPLPEASPRIFRGRGRGLVN